MIVAIRPRAQPPRRSGPARAAAYSNHPWGLQRCEPRAYLVLCLWCSSDNLLAVPFTRCLRVRPAASVLLEFPSLLAVTQVGPNVCRWDAQGFRDVGVVGPGMLGQVVADVSALEATLVLAGAACTGSPRSDACAASSRVMRCLRSRSSLRASRRSFWISRIAPSAGRRGGIQFPLTIELPSMFGMSRNLGYRAEHVKDNPKQSVGAFPPAHGATHTRQVLDPLELGGSGWRVDPPVDRAHRIRPRRGKLDQLDDQDRHRVGGLESCSNARYGCAHTNPAHHYATGSSRTSHRQAQELWGGR